MQIFKFSITLSDKNDYTFTWKLKYTTARSTLNNLEQLHELNLKLIFIQW